MAEALLVAALIAALLLALSPVYKPADFLAGADRAAAAQKTSPSWIELNQPVGAAGTPVRLGSTVTFATGYPKTVRNPRILVNCYQGEAIVFGMGGAVDYGFQLGGAGSVWLTNGGSADCEAILYYYGFHAGQQTFDKLASTTFSAGG